MLIQFFKYISVGLINTSIAGLLIPVAAISFDIGFYCRGNCE